MKKSIFFVLVPTYLALLALAFYSPASATLNRDGVLGINKTFSAQTMKHGKLGLGIHSQIIDDQEVLQNSQIVQNSQVRQISDYLTLNSSLFISMGFGTYTDIGIALPLYFEKLKSTQPGLDLDQQNQGDLRYRLKFQLPLKDLKIMSIAMILGGTAPTQFDEQGIVPRELESMTSDVNTFNQGSSPLGMGVPTFMAGLGLTLDLGQVAEEFQFLWHFNLGVRKSNISKVPPFEDIFFWSTAAEYEANTYIRFFSELYHETRFKKVGDNEFASEPTTLTLGGVAQTPVGFDFYAGVVLGFNSDYIPVQYKQNGGPAQNNFGIKATPDLSMMFEVTWSGFVISQDDDHDGILNKFDKCPNLAEDKDGFQDEDGCPDLDNDNDGIADLKDKCPNQAEDKDGFEDQDGCPDPDNDKDGVPDSLDKCPNTPQGSDGKEGCPNLDKDNDGIVDSLDKCPNVAETMNGFEDQDGCPDQIQVKEVVKTMILRGVNFKTASAELTPESYGALDEIVTQIQGSPSISFEIAGHTDNKGNATKNQMLSQARAQSIANYFINKGVDSKRLKVMGYGSSRPLSSNKSADGRALNRRVELNRIN